MTRARELANFADDTAGLETLTVSDVTDLSVSASNINSATNQMTHSGTDLNVHSNLFVVDKTNSKVGVGTASPSNVLHVYTTSDVTPVKIENAGGGSTGNSLEINSNSTSSSRYPLKVISGGTTRLAVRGNGNVGIGTASPTEFLHLHDGGGSTAPAIEFTNSANSRGLEIRSTFSGDYHSFKSIGTSSGFDFGTDQSGGTSYMRIDNAGKVGIGTTSPTSGYKLDVVNNGATGIRIGDTSDNSRVQYQLDNNIATTTISKDGSGFNTEYKFKTQNTAGALVDNLSLVGGNVGIGTTSPDSLTHLSTSTGSGSSSGPTLLIENFRTGQIPADTRIGRIAFKQGWTVGAYDMDRAYIDAVVDVDAVWVPGVALGFSTGAYTVAPTERMRINSSGTMEFRNNAHPIAFMGGHTPYTGTYTQTGIYTNQNNNHDDPANGIFIERRRLADNSSGEISNFTIGSRGGQRQFVLDAHGHLSRGVDGGWRIDQSRWRNIGSSWTGHTYLRTPIHKGSSNMFRIKIYVYEYGGSYAGEYVFSGYAYSSGSGSLISTRLHALAGGARGIDMGTSSNGNIWCRVQNSATYYSHYSFDYIGWNQVKPEDFSFHSSAG